MENATKGLLIAAAVLIVILIISFALIIINSTGDSINIAEDKGADTAAQIFNANFKTYEGNRKRGSQVKQLVELVKQNNDKGGDQIVVEYADTATGSATTQSNLDTFRNTTLIQSSYYNVTMSNGTNGRIKTITIKKASD